MSTTVGGARAADGAPRPGATRVLVGPLTVLLALVALVAPATPARAAAADTLLALLNDARADAGLAPLRAHGDLAATAHAWSERMAGSGGISHNPALADQVPGGWRALGENVGMNQPADAAGLHRAWMDSPGHRANILGEQYTHVGIGVVVDDDGAAWATQVFATYPGGARPAEQEEPESEPEEPAEREEPAEPRQERAQAPAPEREAGEAGEEATEPEGESQDRAPTPTATPDVTPTPTPSPTRSPTSSPASGPTPSATAAPALADDDDASLPPAALVALGVGALAGVVVPLVLRRVRSRGGPEGSGGDGRPVS